MSEQNKKTFFGICSPIKRAPDQMLYGLMLGISE